MSKSNPPPDRVWLWLSSIRTSGARICCAPPRCILKPMENANVLVIQSLLDERMFECGFSFMKSSLASSQSICASIAAANCGMALSREKLRISRLIFLNSFLDWVTRSNWVAHRDATPIRYWIQIGFQIIFLVACFFVAIFGWWVPNT